MNMNDNQPSRPTNPDELNALFQKIFSEESETRGMAFQPRSTDVIIAPFTKCGTTWLQQIAHSLQTRGDMDFEEISNVTPWIELAYDLGLDLDADQAAEPRVYKSHLSWHDVPKGGRYIVSFRNPANAFISVYRFFEGFFWVNEAIGTTWLHGGSSVTTPMCCCLVTKICWQIYPAQSGALQRS